MIGKNISQISIQGLEPTPYIDKVNHAKLTDASKAPITVSSEVDRIYAPPLPQTITVSENKKPKYEITRDELTDVVVWNPWETKAVTMADFGPADGWKHMICVEAGAVGKWISLEGGDTWEGGQRIKMC